MTAMRPAIAAKNQDSQCLLIRVKAGSFQSRFSRHTLHFAKYTPLAYIYICIRLLKRLFLSARSLTTGPKKSAASFVPTSLKTTKQAMWSLALEEFAKSAGRAQALENRVVSG